MILIYFFILFFIIPLYAFDCIHGKMIDRHSHIFKRKKNFVEKIVDNEEDNQEHLLEKKVF